MSEAVPPSPSAARLPGLDAARALAVVAMVFGHSADGLLSEALRQTTGVQTYWIFRALTAPLFLFVAGWAVMASVERKGLHGAALLKDRVGRVALLLCLGLLLRWPGWNLPGLFSLEPEVVRHFVGFDALHCIGLSLLLGALTLTLFQTSSARALAMALVCAAFVAGSTAASAWASAAPLPTVLRSALVADRFSPFPLLPWAAYFFAGAAVGGLLPRLGARQWRALALGGAGLALALWAWTWGPFALHPTHPMLFLWRLGQVLMLASLAMTLPAFAGDRLSRIGKSTLVVYVFHLMVVYGWSTFPGLNARWGRVLGLWEVAAVALALLLTGLVLTGLIDRGKRAARRALPLATAALRVQAARWASGRGGNTAA